MPQFVVCVPVSGDTGTVSAPPCGDVDGVHYQPVMMELAAPGAVNFDNSETLFAYGFTAVLTLYVVGWAVGAILSVLKRD